MDVLKNVEGLAFVHFDETDVVRHHLVQRIVRAYDEHKTRIAEQQMFLLGEPRAEHRRIEAAPGDQLAPREAATKEDKTKDDKRISAEAEG
jgi:phosphate starvation-inducible PhoH-like protein